MRDGEWSRVSAGSFVELPACTVHTFVNKTDEDVVWLTGWRPKGFQKFFTDFGVVGSAHDASASAQSVSPEIITGVMKDSESYRMVVKV